MQSPARMTNIIRIAGLYARAMSLAWQANPALMAATTALTAFTALTAPVQVWIVKITIDRLASLIGRGSADGAQDLLLFVALYVGVWMLSQVAQSIVSSFRELLSRQVWTHAEYRIIQRAASLDAAFFDHPGFYDRMSFASDQSYRLNNITGQVLIFAMNLVTLVSLLLLLGGISPLIPIVLVLTIAPTFVSEARYTRKLAEVMWRDVPEGRVMSTVKELLKSREAVKEVRLFQIQDFLLKRYQDVSGRYARNLSAILMAKERVNVLLTLLSLAGTAGLWLYAALRALAGAIGLGDVTLVFQSIEGGRGALNQMTRLGGHLAENTFYLEAFFGFMDQAPVQVAGTLARPAAGAPMPDLRGAIEFHDVSFHYPTADRDVLSGISFTIQPGEKVALVGENGAGKTTLVKLLARLYDPTSGVIKVNGLDLRAVDASAYYRQIGVIFQDFVRYSFTARENIGLGWVEALADDARVRRAASLGGAASLIEGLPAGYDTPLNNQFDGGVDLSGGEWQKVALARAFMRDAPLLILDEPTAALDAYAESEVYQRFAELTDGKTAVFVTHRLSSVRMADRVLVLKGGRLVEQGDHASLMALDGEYARMYRLQAERYRMEGAPHAAAARHAQGA